MFIEKEQYCFFSTLHGSRQQKWWFGVITIIIMMIIAIQNHSSLRCDVSGSFCAESKFKSRNERKGASENNKIKSHSVSVLRSFFYWKDANHRLGEKHNVHMFIIYQPWILQQSQDANCLLLYNTRYLFMALDFSGGGVVMIIKLHDDFSLMMKWKGDSEDEERRDVLWVPNENATSRWTLFLRLAQSICITFKCKRSNAGQPASLLRWIGVEDGFEMHVT